MGDQNRTRDWCSNAGKHFSKHRRPDNRINSIDASELRTKMVQKVLMRRTKSSHDMSANDFETSKSRGSGSLDGPDELRLPTSASDLEELVELKREAIDLPAAPCNSLMPAQFAEVMKGTPAIAHEIKKVPPPAPSSSFKPSHLATILADHIEPNSPTASVSSKSGSRTSKMMKWLVGQD